MLSVKYGCADYDLCVHEPLNIGLISKLVHSITKITRGCVDWGKKTKKNLTPYFCVCDDMCQRSATCVPRGSIMLPQHVVRTPWHFLSGSGHISNGVRREYKNRELIASSWHCPPSSHLARLLSIIVKYYCQSLCLQSPPPPHWNCIRPSTVSASCNSALRLKRLPILYVCH